MSFFDKKEDVIDIQLTPYGKRLLSEGKFKPVYYSFEDDEIIYDYSYANVTEISNNVHTRIKDNARLKAQSIIEGVETNISKTNKLKKEGENQNIQEQEDTTYNYSLSLGNSELSKEYLPSWKVKYLNGILTSSVYYITGSHALYRIPRLSSSIEYKTFVGITDPTEDEREKLDEGIEKIYPDGSYIDIKDDFLLLEISEENVSFSRENFDVEVFQYKENLTNKITGSWLELIPLSFVKKQESVTVEEKSLQTGLNIDTTYVDYFLDVLADQEIDDDVLCQYVGKERKKGVFSDTLNNMCPIEKKERDIYQTTIEEVDEECE